MPRCPNARAALRRRKVRPLEGVLGILAGLAGIALGIFLATQMELPPTDRGYPERYMRAAQAAAMARAVWAGLFVAFGAWLFGASLRIAYGVPGRGRVPLVKTRVAIAVALLGWLLIRSALDDTLRFTNPDASPNSSLFIALGVWMTVAADVPFLFWDAIQRFRARLPAVLARAVTLAKLPESGNVRVSGEIVAGPETLDGDAVHRDNLRAPPESARSVSFLLSDGGRRVWVEMERSVVVADPDEASMIVLRVGDEVTVVGEVAGAGDAPYRDGLPRLAAPEGRCLRVLAGNPSYNRRLMTAAVVALVSAVALLGAAGFLVAFRIALYRG